MLQRFPLFGVFSAREVSLNALMRVISGMWKEDRDPASLQGERTVGKPEGITKPLTISAAGTPEVTRGLRSSLSFDGVPLTDGLFVRGSSASCRVVVPALSATEFLEFMFPAPFPPFAPPPWHLNEGE